MDTIPTAVPDKPRARGAGWRIAGSLWRIAAMLSAWVAAQLLAVALGAPDALAAAVGAAALVPCYLLYRAHAPRATARWAQTRACARHLLICLAVVWAAGQTAAIWSFDAWPASRAGYDAETAALGAGGALLALALQLVLAPVAEEMLMRGVLYRELRHGMRLPMPAAVLLSAAVFSLLHGNLVQIAATFLLGVLLTLSYEIAGTLLVPVALHVLFNLASLAIPAFALAPLAHLAAVVPLACAACVLLVLLAAQSLRGAVDDGVPA